MTAKRQQRDQSRHQTPILEKIWHCVEALGLKTNFRGLDGVRTVRARAGGELYRMRVSYSLFLKIHLTVYYLKTSWLQDTCVCFHNKDLWVFLNTFSQHLLLFCKLCLFYHREKNNNHRCTRLDMTCRSLVSGIPCAIGCLGLLKQKYSL